MKIAKTVVAVLAALLMALSGASSASAAFGLNGLGVSFEESDGSPVVSAGTHPFALRTLVAANTVTDPDFGEVPDEAIRDLVIDFPAGMVGNPTAVPQCSSADFGTVVKGGSSCSAASAIGVANLTLGLGYGPASPAPPTAVYNLEPAPGTAAKIGFVALGVPVTADLTVNPDPPYNVIATLEKIPQPVRFYASDVEVWGNPASPVHDSERGVCATAPTGTCPVNLPEKPFLTTPRSCEGPLSFSFATNSWQNPGNLVSYDVQSPFGMSGCAGLGFAPEISSQPTTSQAAAPSGLQFNLDVDDPGLSAASGTADSDIKKAVVTLPEGMTVNPGIAENLQSCSQADLARETAFSEPGEGCPQASKVGEVEVETPLLEGKLLKGQLFVATPYENPVGSLIALYMVIQNRELGISVRLAGKVEPDPETGQLVTTFGEPGQEIPQFPFSHFRFRFREGARAPLITPRQCGTYTTRAVFTPWANPSAPYATTASFEVKQGPNGGPCPSAGPGPFAPGFEAGTLSNQAGGFSSFLLRWTRADGEQDITRFGATLPEGAAGILAGIPECPQAAIEAAKGKSGKDEQASPSCPLSSELGQVLAGAGAGSQLTYVPGKVYLAGPYKGAPFSVVGIVPAVAGPFDVGTVVTQLALRVNPVTAQVTVDGSTSDPIPHILAGIPLAVRDIRSMVDRPGFTFNPTSCRESQVGAQLWGGGGDPFSVADDSPFATATRFQAAGCGSLGFKPQLRLWLKGGTKRSDNPALRAVYTPRPGDANLRRMVVRFPGSLFVEQGHIRTVCTRVQFAADACPAGAIYGRVRAFTPILDQPLEGPVYLRSNGGERDLPDLVFALNGRVKAEVTVEIDSSKGGLRATVRNAPDVPISKVVLNMQGGNKSLIVNSTNLCVQKPRANLALTAHSGARAKGRPPLRIKCKGGNPGRGGKGR